MILTIVYNTQNYWGFRPRPSSGILETRKHNVSETESVSKMLNFLIFRIRKMDEVQNQVILSLTFCSFCVLQVH
jgi:hypothetical protein